MGKATKSSAAPASASASPAVKQAAESVGDEGKSVADMIAEELGALPESPEGGTDEEESEGDEPEADSAETTEESESADEEQGEESESEGDESETEESEEEEESEGAEGEESTEGEEESESEDEQGEGDEDAEGKDKGKKKPSPGLQRRFSELTAENRTLKEKLEAAEAKAARPARAPSTVEAEVEAVETAEDLQALEDKYAELEEWATVNEDGLEIPPAKEGDEPKVISAQQMRQTLLNVRKGQRLLKKREESVKATETKRAEFSAYAAEVYPDYKDEDSELSNVYASVLKRVPELRRLPNIKVIIADAYAGQKLRVDQAKKAAGDKARPGKPIVKTKKLPPVMPSPGVRKPASSSAQSKKQKISAAIARAERTGSEEDIALAIEAGLG